MSAITSGTYGHQPAFTTGLRQLVGLFASTFAAQPKPVRFVNNVRTRVREANDVRELARSVEMHSPGFAADLYAAASRHEGLDD